MRLRYGAVLPIIVVTCLIFILQVVLGDSFTQMFMLLSTDIWTRPWILVTYMFLHANATHLLLNMYGLFIFGPLLEARIGPERFLGLYFGAGVLAALLASVFYPAAVGASGALMGILGALIVLMPDLQLLLFFFIPMPLWAAGILWATLDALGVLFPSNVANIAHLVGLGVGLGYGWYLRRKRVAFHQHFAMPKSPQKDKQDAMELDEEDIERYIKYGRI